MYWLDDGNAASDDDDSDDGNDEEVEDDDVLLLSHFSLCPTLCNPIDGSPQAPPSLGFSRQEHWSGLPFPSPMRESEVTQSCPTSQPHGLQPPRLLHPWDFPGKSTGVGCRCVLR